MLKLTVAAADALRVAAGADALGKFRPMQLSEVEFIENWEAEAYRKQIAAKAASGKPEFGLE